MTTPPGTGAELLSYERHGSVALLTLNRPDKLNAINVAMQGALDRALTQAETDATVRAIVVNGAGRAFSAGFDLDMELGNSATPDASAVRRALENDFRLIMRFWDSPKVTLAAVHGYCLGGALELALACDLTIASDADAICQVLTRLLENAIKFTPEGGFMGLEAHEGVTSDTVNLVVWDTGIGIRSDTIGVNFQTIHAGRRKTRPPIRRHRPRPGLCAGNGANVRRNDCRREQDGRRQPVHDHAAA